MQNKIQTQVFFLKTNDLRNRILFTILNAYVFIDLELTFLYLELTHNHYKHDAIKSKRSTWNV